MKQAKLKEVDLSQVADAIEDINNVCCYDPKIKSKGSKKAILNALEKKITSADGALEDYDFVENGENCLSLETVELLLLLEIKNIPKGWEELVESMQDDKSAENNALMEEQAIADSQGAEANNVEESPVKKDDTKESKPKAKAKAKPKAKKTETKVKKVTQVFVIEEMMDDNKSDDQIVKALMEKFNKDEKQAKARLKLHQNFLKRRGENE